MNLSQLYEKDFYAWTVETVNQLRSKQLNKIDIDHLAEEVESMGASERRQLQSRLEVLLMHLLKWQYQPSYQGKSWILTIEEQRARIKDHLKDNPSLKASLQAFLDRSYRYAVIKAVNETGLNKSTFPSNLPYTITQILNDDFYPNNEE